MADFAAIIAGDRALVKSAIEASTFAPWSQYKVGVAAKTGVMVVKSRNVEKEYPCIAHVSAH